MEELALSLLVLVSNTTVKVLSAFVATSYTLDESAGSDSGLEGPLDFEHAPVFLQIDDGPRLFVTLFLRFTI